MDPPANPNDLQIYMRPYDTGEVIGTSATVRQDPVTGEWSVEACYTPPACEKVTVQLVVTEVTE
jgi:hypothetical protein